MNVSLKQNIISSYISQAYVVSTGILVLPFYITEMGAEAYGLVGFFAMLQAMFNLLDLGLTPTIGRETARYRAGAHSEVMFNQLYRTLNLIFIGVAVIGGGALFLLANTIAQKWLNIEALAVSDVIFALQVMAISVALRWMTGLFRGVVTGSEQIVWLSGLNAFIATLRFLIVFPVMWKFGTTPTVFFTFQLGVALLEFSWIWLKANQLRPRLNADQKSELVWSFKPIKPYLKFAGMIAFTTAIWVLITQSDKLVLSGILSLEDYGYFTLAVLVASGVMTISAPLSAPLIPRMTKLYSENKNKEMLMVYSSGTEVAMLISITTAMVIAFFPEKLLFVWTGDANLSKKVSPILQLYVIGNGFLVLAAFPGYLQNAMGNLKYHFIGNIIILVLLLPSSILAAMNFGAIGAGWIWLIMNVTYFILWVAYSHYKLVPGFHYNWLKNIVIKPLFFTTLVLLMLNHFVIDGFNRTYEFIILGVVSVLAFFTTLISISNFRVYLFNKFKSIF